MATNFAEFIKQQRERQGISRYRLARLAGLTITAITKYESGERSPSVAIAARICKALNAKYVIK